MASALQHYSACKTKAPLQTSLCVLVQTTCNRFSKHWHPMLSHMAEHPCSLNGYSFFTDVGQQPQPTKVVALNSTQAPKMSFFGAASGAPCSFLVDTGATHCFMDSTFAAQIGISQRPVSTSVQLANNTVEHASSQCTPTIHIQGHRTRVSCFIIDMQQQFDIILGDTWLSAVKANIDYASDTCTVQKKGQRYKLHPVLKTTPSAAPSSVHSMLLNHIAVKRSIRKGARVFAVQVKPSTETDAVQASPPIKALIQEFQDVFSPISELPPVRDTGHTIPLEPNTKPPFRPMYRLSPKELEEVERQVKELLQHGLIEPSSSPFGASVLFVAKKDGSLRMCIDYRALNKITVKNKYPLPRIDQLLDALSGAQLFTSLDLQSGYHQIRITEEDVAKTAFRTPFGHYQFKVLSFGLTNAPATFQAAMNNMLRPYLNQFVVVYIDDILIFSKTQAEHISHVRKVLELLREQKFHIKLSKCEFEQPEVKFLGHIVGKNGVKVDPSKTAVLEQWPVPKSVHDVRSFVGLATYFRRFVEKFSQMVAPLTRLTGKDIPFVWDESCQRAFEQVKHALTNAPILALPNFELPFEVITDASIEGLGGILLQNERPLAYESRRLIPAEVNYTTGEQELLAVVHALTIWRCYLEGADFTVVTDHNPLIYLPTQPNLSRRQARWVEYLQRFSFKWVYRPGKSNAAADALSRNPPEHSSLAVALLFVITRRQRAKEVNANTPVPEQPTLPQQSASRTQTGRRATTADPESEGPDSSLGGEEPHTMDESDPAPLHTSPPDHGELVDIYEAVRSEYGKDPRFANNGATTANFILRDGLWWTRSGQLIIPESMGYYKRAIIRELHDAPYSGHPGIAKTKKLVQKDFYWGSMLKDVKDYIQSCHSCQQNKSSNQKSGGLLQPLLIPERKWQVVTMDFIMSLPETDRGHTAILVVVDKLTKMVHLIPTTVHVTGEETARLYLDHVWKHHGVPESIVSDRDPRFTGKFMTEFLKLLGTKQRLSTAFHPQTDGQTERTNRTLEDMLRHYVDPNHTDWDTHLAAAEFAINNSYQESIKTTPFRLNTFEDPPTPMTLGKNSRVPAAQMLANQMEDDLLRAKAALQSAQDRQKLYADKKRRPIHYRIGDQVMLNAKNIRLRNPGSPKFMPKWLGPFTIIDTCDKHRSREFESVHPENPGPSAVRLDLPASMRIHNVFHVSLLKPYKSDGSRQPPPMPIELEGEEWFIVESILNHRDRQVITPSTKTKKKPKRPKVVREYLIKWKGYSDDHNTWEPEENVTPEAISAYKQYRSAPLG